ncbi:uncharacterized protein LOC128236097 [Mya arenaria]|uniref:uncharacterized protein LOC128236097 n=1 Tax=Mya arenaria TaxID=6604 RepID=UPI0022E4F310|nr:uncharacterized protein LOC128236097 [Mya arenaria]
MKMPDWWITVVCVSHIYMNIFTCEGLYVGVLENLENVRKEEGQNITLFCNETAQGDVKWTTPDGTKDGHEVNIHSIKRVDAGIYVCYNNNGTNIKDIVSYYIDVLYPASIDFLNASTSVVLVNEEYTFQLNVDGNPPPFTTLKLAANEKLYFNGTQTGKFTIDMHNRECTETQEYIFTSENKYGKDVKTQNISVIESPKSDPEYSFNSTYTPRIGDTITLVFHSIGCPFPSFKWSHGDEILKHSDDKMTTSVTIPVTGYMDFGYYTVEMENSAGQYVSNYEFLATGPPDPLEILKVEDVKYFSASIVFRPGFNYGESQTFSIKQQTNDGSWTTIKENIADETDGKGKGEQIYTLDELSASTSYKLQWFAVTSRGYSAGSNILDFTSADEPRPTPQPPNSASVIKSSFQSFILCFVATLLYVVV